MKYHICRIFYAPLVLMLLTNTAIAQSDFYNSDIIQKIEIRFSQTNWDYQLDTAKIGSDRYLMADWIKINGVSIDSIGVKYKGNSSYDSAYIKNPLHISLNEFKNQSYEGYTDIKLSNVHADPSMIREVLSYKILSNYMDCPGSNFAQVYINDQYTGLYTNVESISIEYCSDHFYTSEGTFIKASPEDPGPYNRSNLKYISGDSTDYDNLYEIKSIFGWNDLVSLCNLVSNNPYDIDSVFDIDRVLWMLAFDNMLVSLDSYLGAFAQNYYLYRDNHYKYNVLVWDLNMSFGGFPFAGMQGGGMGSLTIADMQHLPVSLHFADSDWPLIKNIMSNDRFRRMYHAHLRTIAGEIFSSQLYSDWAQQLQAIIDTAVQSDVNKFFSYEDFTGGLTTNVQFGSYMIPGISVLMDERTDFLQNSNEFSYTAPAISAVTPDNVNPELNEEVYITTHVNDADSNSVFLGYRFENGDIFNRVLMFDDGVHHDGAAGDKVYGASFILQAEWVDYYIYAENDLAGSFSPARAEHEFYSLNAELITAIPGEIVFNEFLALNQNDTVDETGQHEDWIELYNTSDSILNLYGLYLTDDFSNPMKFAIPENTMMPPHSYLIIWADEDSTTTSYLHCNFKLSGNGEELMLSDIEGTLLDSLSFGPQAADISIGRCPDGTGEMTVLSNTTFNSSNCESGISDHLEQYADIAVLPNPANATLNIIKQVPGREEKIYIINVLNEIYFKGLLNDKIIIDTSVWPVGIYFVVINQISPVKVIIVH